MYDAVLAAMATIEKDHGKGAILCAGDSSAVAPFEVIPTGSMALDTALGTGGYPRGRIVEVYGPESSGKTTLALHAIAEVHRQGGMAAFIDAEHAFDVRYAAALGVDVSRLLVAQPDSGEQGLDIVETLVDSKSVSLVVIDSVAALVPKAEIEGAVGDTHMGLHARLMAQGVRKLNNNLEKARTTLFFINQLRQKIGVVFGNPETTTGGQALRFFASMRLDVRRIGKVLAGDTATGNRTRVKVVKNKCAMPFGEAEFDTRWGVGIDSAAELLDVAESRGALTKNGAYYVFDGKTIGQGREKAREALLAQPELRTAIAAAARGEKSTGARKKAA
jgi:recombination protein RecA